jgi:hypothetical protein
MSKGKVVILVALLGLAVLNVTLALMNFTSLGVPFKYEKAAMPDKQAFDSLASFPDELFGRKSGWDYDPKGGRSLSEEFGNRVLSDYHTITAWPDDPAKVQPMKKLREVVETIQQKARTAGFALSLPNLHCAEFGEEGAFDPTPEWSISTKSVDGHQSTRSTTGFPGTRRFAVVGIDLIAPKNPARRFHWTILCDRKEKSFVLMQEFLDAGPVYVGPTTPNFGHYFTITPGESPESGSLPAPTTRPEASTGP